MHTDNLAIYWQSFGLQLKFVFIKRLIESYNCGCQTQTKT